MKMYEGKRACDLKPNCFHGLKYKAKHGIWRSLPSHIAALGPDPAVRIRDGTIKHAGLKNLGATWYVH